MHKDDLQAKKKNAELSGSASLRLWVSAYLGLRLWVLWALWPFLYNRLFIAALTAMCHSIHCVHIHMLEA